MRERERKMNRYNFLGKCRYRQARTESKQVELFEFSTELTISLIEHTRYTKAYDFVNKSTIKGNHYKTLKFNLPVASELEILFNTKTMKRLSFVYLNL